MVASGGCTALSLKHEFPRLDVVAFDFNPAALAHVREKAAAVERGELRQLNVGDASRTGLNQRGDFEGLFRTLRGFLLEFVLTEEELEEGVVVTLFPDAGYKYLSDKSLWEQK